MIINCIKSAELSLQVLEKEYERTNNKELLNDIYKLQELINLYKENMKKMPEIENRLYYKIVYENKGVNRAVDEICDENSQQNISPSSRTRIFFYYKKIKDFIKLY